MKPGEPCARCGAPSGIYMYPRPGGVPGNMLVCTNDECEASIAGMQRRQQAELDRQMKEREK